MTLGEVVARLNSGKAPRLAPETVAIDANGRLALASGPTIRFDTAGRLVGMTIPSPATGRALVARGFDHPFLDLLGQSARAAARALGGRRLDAFVFDGRVDKTTGVTAAFETNARGLVESLDLQWYPLRAGLGADTKFAGLSLGEALTKVPKSLGADAVLSDDGWHIPSTALRLAMGTAADGVRRLVGLTVDALPTPAAALARDPLLSLAGADVAKLVATLGPPASGDPATEPIWQAPSPYRPAWSLRATVEAGRVQRLTITAAP